MSYINLSHIKYRIRPKKGDSKVLFEDLNLSISQGEVVCLSGANGIGKTTLSKLIIGMIKPDSGQITLDGKDIKKYKLHEISREVGYLFQNTNIQLFNRTVRDELLFASSYGVTIQGDVESRFNEVYHLLDLEKTGNTPIVHLSQGEKQRVAIGTILMNQTKFIILDEPTVSLDEIRKNQLIQLMKQLNEQGIGLLVISHDIDFIRELDGRHLIMKSGGVIVEQ